MSPIVCAAMRYKEFIVVGVRHCDDLMKAQIKRMPRQMAGAPWEEGFLDTRGDFLNRQDAFIAATEHNQVDMRRNESTNTLFSIGLY